MSALTKPLDALAWMRAVFARECTLDAHERLVLLALVRHADASGNAWPSIATLAAETRVGRTKLIEVLATLEARRILARERQTRGLGFGSNKYRLPIDPPLAALSATRTRSPGEPVRDATGGSSPGGPRVVRQADGGSSPGEHKLPIELPKELPRELKPREARVCPPARGSSSTAPEQPEREPEQEPTSAKSAEARETARPEQPRPKPAENKPKQQEQQDARHRLKAHYSAEFERNRGAKPIGWNARDDRALAELLQKCGEKQAFELISNGLPSWAHATIRTIASNPSACLASVPRIGASGPGIRAGDLLGKQLERIARMRAAEASGSAVVSPVRQLFAGFA